MPSGSLNSDSPLVRGRSSIAAMFDSSETASVAVQALSAAGFQSGEIQSEARGEDYLVTVTHPDRLQEAAVILQQQGGSFPEGDSTDFTEVQAAIDADEEAVPDASVPPDSGISERPGSGRKVGGGTFTRSSGSGGQGSGTATGGSLFGSNR